jgi:hypothetical protein
MCLLPRVRGIETAFSTGQPYLLILSRSVSYGIPVTCASSDIGIVSPFHSTIMLLLLFLACSMAVAHLQLDGM